MAAQYTDLEGSIDFSQAYALNALPSAPISNVLLSEVLAQIKQGPRDQPMLFCSSDTDEQLILHIPFQSAVKIHSLSIEAPAESAPSSLKLFVNKVHVGFSECQDETATQEIPLTADSVKEGAAALLTRFVKFQNVNALTIFVAGNQGDAERTTISKLVLYGVPLQGTKIAELKKIDGQGPMVS